MSDQQNESREKLRILGISLGVFNIIFLLWPAIALIPFIPKHPESFDFAARTTAHTHLAGMCVWFAANGLMLYNLKVSKDFFKNTLLTWFAGIVIFAIGLAFMVEAFKIIGLIVWVIGLACYEIALFRKRTY
jgi:uncharacterized membrane protein HdeD (DUF308 family)|tara:strand:- start:988 stop:1383 length:396 start_codon:yes stop_codon:yes gene_type:complete